MSKKEDEKLAKDIRKTEQTTAPVEGKLETDDRVLARITEGIYRQPASALRELVSNAYDADATEVIILTDAPRFGQISVRDNGHGLSPEILTHLVKHIGSSAKRDERGVELHMAASNSNFSPGGRQFIGKLGIGLFSVAQFTRHFLIISKTKGDKYRTVADIILGKPDQKLLQLNEEETRHFETGHYQIWREPAQDSDAHGTEIKLLELLPRTRDELASDDVWTRQDNQKEDPEAPKTDPPKIHIGRLRRTDGIVTLEASLPWAETDGPRARFEKLIERLRALTNERESVDIRKVCDNYLWSLWTLAVSIPVPYLEGHPFDFHSEPEFKFFEIENRVKGQAKEITLKRNTTLRKTLGLKTPDGATAGRFEVFMDGVQLFRPILFRGLPRSESSVKENLLFIGRHREEFSNRQVSLSGGPLQFEAYLFWAPKIVPKQNQGVVLRVGNASGALFDPDFMGYETSEHNRKAQITAEIFVSEGLDDAINLDRESFNYAHPHYQYLTKWLHSAFRQFSNRQKELAKQVLTARRAKETKVTKEKLSVKVEEALKLRGIEDIPEVVLLERKQMAAVPKLRHEGKLVLIKETVVPRLERSNQTAKGKVEQELAEKRAIAITQLLQGMGLLGTLSYDEQEQLVRDIMEIVRG